MRILRQLFNLKRTACNLVGGLLLVGLLGGCTPLVNVAVQVDNTCSSGGSPSRSIESPAPGTCSLNPATPYNGPLIPANYKVCKDFNHNTVACTGNEMCTGSTGSRVCNDPPGSELGRKMCKSVWTQSVAGSMNGTCQCTSAF